MVWIEQIATKRDGIGANKAVAVSSSGFSSGAKKKAIAKSIELRTYGEITKEKIQNWFLGDSIAYYNQKYQIKNISFKAFNQKHQEKLNHYFKERGGNINQYEKIFYYDGVIKPLSVDELFKGISNIDSIFKKVKPNQKIEEKIKIMPENKKKLKIFDKDEEILIDFIAVIVDMWVEESQLDLIKVEEYRKSEQPMAQILTFEDPEKSEDGLGVEIIGIPNEEGFNIGIRLKRRE